MGHTFKDDKGKQDGGRAQALRLVGTLEDHLAMIEPAGVGHSLPLGPAARRMLAEGVGRFVDESQGQGR